MTKLARVTGCARRFSCHTPLLSHASLVARPPCCTQVTRTALEEHTRDLLERVHRPILAALEQAGNLSTEALDGLELVGGGWRVPAVQEEIQSLLAKAGSGKDLPTALSKTLNADEAVRARR